MASLLCLPYIASLLCIQLLLKFHLPFKDYFSNKNDIFIILPVFTIHSSNFWVEERFPNTKLWESPHQLMENGKTRTMEYVVHTLYTQTYVCIYIYTCISTSGGQLKTTFWDNISLALLVFEGPFFYEIMGDRRSFLISLLGKIKTQSFYVWLQSFFSGTIWNPKSGKNKKWEQQRVTKKPTASSQLGTLSLDSPSRHSPARFRTNIYAWTDTAKCHGHLQLFPDSHNHKC